MFLLPMGGDKLVRSMISSFWVGSAVNGTRCLSFCVAFCGLAAPQCGQATELMRACFVNAR